MLSSGQRTLMLTVMILETTGSIHAALKKVSENLHQQQQHHHRELK